ncbi:MAG: DEAD/DEAH box helicase [Deltaproteobacteria bacterium]|nr:DEAD/DEAH box helicase [Deltaproteobacteria bacterium]
MNRQNRIGEYVRSLKASPGLGGQVVFHKELPATEACFDSPARPWPDEMQVLLKGSGISSLYSHQVSAIDLVRSGRHIVVSTPTASGKTLVYNLPVIEQILEDPLSRALYLFPLKALAQDQMKQFGELTACLDREQAPTCATYDGDTSAWKRKRSRELPPNVLLTNPEMLHLSLLAYHEKWASFWQGLTHVVIDEVHTYRGVMGSHMAWVFRRMNRVCAHYGVSPTFVFCSATVGNPSELTSRLTGLDVQAVTKNSAPHGRRHVLFINPEDGAAQTAIKLLRAALYRGLRTIVYTQSRKLAELINIWVSQRAGSMAERISAYRAGYLPEERREIERRLSSGELLAVISTSALELGIDIGSLDLCLLVGYPGTVMATWQRGGRVGRSLQDSALVLIAQEDALDQYFMRNPMDFFKRSPEPAVLNPGNPVIMGRHLVCAASEITIRTDESWLKERGVSRAISKLESKGKLLRSEDGKEIYSARKFPQRGINLRGVGQTYQIVSRNDGRTIGAIDGFRAYRETHPGAVYLHRGESYVVDRLDIETRTVEVSPARVDYFTRVRGDKTTEILEVFGEKVVYATSVSLGRLRITDQITGYERRHVRGQRLLNIVPLDLPPQVFETEGLWIEIPNEVQKATENAYMHFMGGIHALEHAAIGILPLMVLTDRNDLGGISTPYHPQVRKAAVFVYDGIPGGVGLSRQAFEKAEELLKKTLNVIESCPCELGCPSCVHSPKCGSGNRPIDKRAAIFVLKGITESGEGFFRSGQDRPYAAMGEERMAKVERQKYKDGPDSIPRFGVFDLETQLSAQEVGGWHRADLMRLSCAVLFDSERETFLEFREPDIPELIERLSELDLIIGFNLKRFDYKVLSAYNDLDFWSLPTLDILEDVHTRLGYRLSLDHLAGVTLGTQKTANGMQALKWWKQGKIKEILEYCNKDVAITRDLFLYGYKKSYLLFMNKARKIVRIPVDWRRNYLIR